MSGTVTADHHITGVAERQLPPRVPEVLR